MTKAWDFADLVVRLKANGLVMAEKEAKDATMAILGWTKDSLVMEGGVVAMFAAPAIELAQPMIMKMEDKIDGIDGN